MKLRVGEYSHQGNSLIGRLFIDEELACYTLEDWPESVNNRIPRGTYKVVLRNEGSVHELYAKKFPEFHKGCLHVLVPGRKWILIHIGNTDLDTLGCLLVGTTNNNNGSITDSTTAYKRIYPRIAEAILAGKEVTIHYEAIPESVK